MKRHRNVGSLWCEGKVRFGGRSTAGAQFALVFFPSQVMRLKSVLIIGGGVHGLQLLKTLEAEKSVRIVCVVDENPRAPALKYAAKKGIATDTSWLPYIRPALDIAVNAATDAIDDELIRRIPSSTAVIPYNIVRAVAALMNDKEKLIRKLKEQSELERLILNLTHDGMVAIDARGIVTLFNPSAETIMGLKRADVIGRHVQDVIPTTELPRLLHTGQPEINRQQSLNNGKTIITTRLPILDEQGRPRGAFAVFKDITDVEKLADEITDLRAVQTMLNAIIQSAEEAISVVDENGNGILINPAYTRLTGLTEKEVIGKPATIDISEGESMHMKVLKTGKPVRGARMKVGQAKRDVVVNVAPIVVDGAIKGSVAIIQDMTEITALTDELQRARQLIRSLEAKYTFDDIIAVSEAMRWAIDQAKSAAGTPITVLLRGESGTGKELFAHAIHNASPRRYKKFVRVNCAALSESLLESELFGYDEGAFSGAKKGGKRGFFEEAHGGSIFLDEIGELSPRMQAKLLRVLQEKEIVRVGGTKPVPVDVRVIAATNVNLEKRMAEGTFREDLYYRLNRLPIFIPPLRQRKEDIPPLAKHLLNKINRDFGRHVWDIAPEAVDGLIAYDWPGNVRELENILERAVIRMAVHETRVEARHLPPLDFKAALESPRMAPGAERPPSRLADLVTAYEREIIQKALKDHDYNKTKTAKALGLSVRNLYYKLDKLGIERSGLQ